MGHIITSLLAKNQTERKGGTHLKNEVSILAANRAARNLPPKEKAGTRILEKGASLGETCNHHVLVVEMAYARAWW